MKFQLLKIIKDVFRYGDVLSSLSKENGYCYQNWICYHKNLTYKACILLSNSANIHLR